MKFRVFTPYNRASLTQNWRIVDFLDEHLAQYGDEREDIHKCLQYAQKEKPAFGGFILTAHIDSEMVGVVVINKTGMEGYIPENILVYVAVHGSYRGQGIGSRLMKKAIALADGDIALHVEPDNPARHLYKRLGFENNYLEMRLKQDDADGAQSVRDEAAKKKAEIES